MGGKAGAGQAQSGNYALGQSLTSMAGVDPTHPEYQYVLAGFNDANAQRARDTQMAGMFESMFSGGENQQPQQGDGWPTYEEQRAQAEEDRLIAEEHRLRAEGIRERDGRIENYFTAANEATRYVTEAIAGEQANAATLGVDYVMTDELKAERIADHFSSLWSESDQASLEGSIGEFGNDSNFEQTVFRGKGSKEAGKTADDSVNPFQAMDAHLASTGVDDEEKLGASSLLSGVKK
jgi:hypothetical protein